MQDRPDLLQSEMQGLAFDSLETVFRDVDVKQMLDLEPLPTPTNTTVFIVVDPAGAPVRPRVSLEERRRPCSALTAWLQLASDCLVKPHLLVICPPRLYSNLEGFS